jgi:hypothetical protein
MASIGAAVRTGVMRGVLRIECWHFWEGIRIQGSNFIQVIKENGLLSTCCINIA